MALRRRIGVGGWLRVGLVLACAIVLVVEAAPGQQSAVAASTTLYVDKNAVNCSDTGAGTAAQPFCSIGAAASSAATSGTTVLVSSGTYSENVKITHSGASGAPITFQPAAGASVTLTGQLHAFTVANQSWIAINGFTITGTSGYGILLDTSTQITVNGNHVSYAGQPVSGQTAQGIYLTATTNSLIENNTVDHNTAAGVSVLNSSTGVEIRHNLFFNNASQYQRLAEGVDIESASAIVDYNVTHDNEDSGIQFYPGGNNGIAFDNISYNNGDHGIDDLDVTGGVIVGNTIYHNCTTGINVEGTSGNYRLENNIAVDNAVYPAYNGISCNRRTGNIGIWDSAPPTTTADYNIVNLTTTGNQYVWNGTNYSTLASLQAASGQEAHGVWADPKWTNAGGGNFHLLAGSPAIDSADSSAPSEPARDAEGNARVDDPATTNTGPGVRAYDDRGALEYQPVPGGSACQTSGPTGGTYTVTVCLTQPGQGAVVSGAVPISFTVSTAGSNVPALTQPVVLLDGQYFTQSFTTAPPFNKFSLPTNKYVDGAHTLSVEADMQDGFKSSWATVSLDFSNGVITPPINTGTFTPVSGPMPPSGSYVIGAVGDGANGSAAADSVASMIASWNPSLFLYLGDVYQHASVGDFYNLYGQPGSHYGQLKSITNPTIGNHEYEMGTPAAYFDYWNNVPHYYSFNVAGWHFISLDTTSDFGQLDTTSPEYNWLLRDLQTNTSPCVAVYSHRPRFGASWTGGSPDLQNYWALFAQYNVKLVLNGHEHDYQRWTPLDANGNPSPTGVTEFVVGSGGNGIDSISNPDSRLAFADGTGGDYGALRLTLTTSGANYQFVRTDGTIPDSGTIGCTANDTQPPSVPKGLAGSAAANGQVNLSWSPSTDNVGVAGYTVYRNGTAIATTPGAAYTDSTAAASTTYQYTVDAYDAAANHSAQSAGVSVTTPAPDTQAPTVPAGLAATATGPTTASLSWTASTDNVGVAGYTVYRNGTAVTTTATTSFSDAGLSPATTYTYSVDAYDGAGNHSAPSTAIPVTTAQQPAAFVQSAINSTGNRVTSTTVVLKAPVAAGDLLTGLFGEWDATGQVQVSDNVNGAWTRIRGMRYSTGKGDVALYYVPHAKASAAGITITISAAKSTYLMGTVAEYAGMASTPLDQTSMASGTGTSLDSGPTAAVPAGELVYAAMTTNNNPGTISAGSTQGQRLTLRASYDNSGEADLLAAPAGAQNGRFTITSSTPWYSVVAVFKPAPTDTQPPTVPAGLAATPGVGSVGLSWSAATDNVGVAGYTVYRNGAVLATVGPSSLAYTDSSVSSATQYSYAIDAFDAAGNHSAASAAVSVTTPDWLPPSTPAGVTASAVSASQVNVSWGASTDNVGVAGYDVYRGGSLLATVTAAATAYSDTSVLPSTSYAYTVDAFDAAGNHSAVSASATAVTPGVPDTTAPTVPQNVSATAGAAQVNIAWSASTDDVAVSGYTIYRNGSVLTTVPGTALAYADTTAASMTSYTYAVDAFDTAGNHSSQSAPVPVATPDWSPPSVPGGLAAGAASATEVDLAWNPSTDDVGVAGYTVYRNGSAVATVAAPATSFADTSVASGGTYSYTVDAFDAAGNHSAQSAAAAATTPDVIPPSTPGGLAATALSPTAVGLGWSAATDNVGVAGYDVYRDGGLLATLGASATSYTDAGVASGSSHGYSVDAFDAAGNHSPVSASVTVTTPTADTTPPSTPTGLAATATASPPQVSLAWGQSTDNVGVAGYDVYRGGVLLATVGAATLTYVDTGVVGGTTYSYAVDAFDAAGNHSAPSAAVSAHVPAQPRYVQSKIGTTGTRVTTTTIVLGAVARGDLLVGWFGQYDASGQVQVSDNVNGPWTRSASTTWHGSTAPGDIALYYFPNAAAAPSGLTITITAPAATYLQGGVAEYSGVAAVNPLDQVAVASGSGTSADSGLTPAVGAGELAFGGMVTTSNAGTLTAGTSQGVGYVKRAQSTAGTQAVEDITATAAGQQHAGFTLTTSAAWYMVCAVFKPA